MISNITYRFTNAELAAIYLKPVAANVNGSCEMIAHMELFPNRQTLWLQELRGCYLWTPMNWLRWNYSLVATITICPAWISFCRKPLKKHHLWFPCGLQRRSHVLLLEMWRTWLMFRLMDAVPCGDDMKLVLGLLVALSNICCDDLIKGLLHLIDCLFSFTFPLFFLLFSTFSRMSLFQLST